MNEINLMILQLLVSITCGEYGSCTRKVGHETEVHAQMESDKLNASGPNRRTGKKHKVEPYPCGWCFRWHVGRDMSMRRIWYLSAGVRHQKGEWGNEARDSTTHKDPEQDRHPGDTDHLHRSGDMDLPAVHAK